MTQTPVHASVARVVAAYLDAVDAEAPGLVEGLYLVGSVALGEFRPNTSDIDFVAVTSRQPDPAALARAHDRLGAAHPRPWFDGRYVTWDELAADPLAAKLGPYAHEGRFHASGDGDCNPVTWATVARHGVRCRGPETRELRIHVDPAALAAWTRGNLASYWKPLLGRCRSWDPWRLTSLTSYGTVWIVLGVCRLRYTLATGEIGSKEAAGEHALRTMPANRHRILEEALRIRRADDARPAAGNAVVEMLRDIHHSRYPTPFSRRRDILAFADEVVAEGLR